MEVVERISTVMSESWVAWVLFVLLVLQAMNRFFIPDMAVVLRGLFSRSERTYVDASWQSAVLEWVYRMGVIALAVYLCVFGNAPCSILDYLWVLCMMAGVLLMQYGIARLVGVVFLGARQMEGAFGGVCDSIKLIGIITDMERVANVLQEFALDILYIALCGRC